MPFLRGVHWRGAFFLRILGLAALATCLAARPPFVDAEGIVAYLASVLVAAVTTDLAIVPLLQRFGRLRRVRSPQDAHEPRPRAAPLALRDALVALAEDGLVFVPLLLAGPNPILALVAAMAVASLHFPQRPLRDCIWKGIHVFAVAMIVLPYGLAAIALGHLLTLAIAHRPWSPEMLRPLAASTQASR